MPDGFEIYETPNAQVFLRRLQPKIITDVEKAMVEQGMKRFSTLKYYQIDVKKNAIIIFEANQHIRVYRGYWASCLLPEAAEYRRCVNAGCILLANAPVCVGR